MSCPSSRPPLALSTTRRRRLREMLIQSPDWVCRAFSPLSRTENSSLSIRSSPPGGMVS